MDSCMYRYVYIFALHTYIGYSGEEEMPLIITSATFDHYGGKLIIEKHDVTITHS